MRHQKDYIGTVLVCCDSLRGSRRFVGPSLQEKGPPGVERLGGVLGPARFQRSVYEKRCNQIVGLIPLWSGSGVDGQRPSAFEAWRGPCPSTRA